ncbi:MAG: sulfite exporter TauE/SafE family protein [Gammaproteobacteria bacterium]|nr:sulfite exporter TauE/SafE family protein [Gammaproteobacteria bacterium]
MFDALTISIVVITFLLAGTVKGVIGLGLPTVSLALLTVFVDLPNAMALLLIPSLVTNIWQAAMGGNGKDILQRLWLFFLMATITVWFGATALTRIDLALLSALLGVLLVVYATVSLAGYRFTISKAQESWTGPMAGTVNGVLTGMTGSFVVPGVMYLQSIGLSRDVLVQAMGILFTLSTLALAIALQGNGLLTIELGKVSAAAIIPAFAGMILGQRFRRKLSEQLYKRIFFIALLLLGSYIIVSALSGFVARN